VLAVAVSLGCRTSASPEPTEQRAAALAASAAPATTASGAGGTATGSAATTVSGTATSPTAPRMLSYEQRCMGTRCTVQAYHHDAELFERAVRAAMAEIERLDQLLSTWVPSSEVSRINAAAGKGEWIAISSETLSVLEKSLWIAKESQGAFDVTVGAFKGLWKFDEDNDGSLPARADVLARLKLVDYRGLLLDSPAQPSTRLPVESAAQPRARLRRAGQSLTLGGIAKGLVVDRAVAALRAAGLKDFLMQAGGDLYAAGRHGDREWKVGIQDPRATHGEERSTDSSFALLALTDCAFNTSGDYERFILRDGKRYHHILDPRSGYPVSHTRSVTVLAPTSFLADTLDTAVFALGAEQGLKLIARVPGAEAVIVDGQNKVHVSPGLSGRLRLLRSPSDGI
jgi:FAD:protein FMN transferase